MKVTNIEHVHISDEYKIHTEEGIFTLTVTMLPHKETEPTMRVIRDDGIGVDSGKEEEVVKAFLSAGSPQPDVAS